MAYFAPYIEDTGLHMPTYEDRLEDLVSAYRSIFGVDAEMSESVPDYQLLSGKRFIQTRSEHFAQ